MDKIRHSSQIGEVEDVLRRSLAGIDAAKIGDPALSEIADSLRPLLTELSEAIKRDRFASLLDGDDIVRDNRIRAVFYLNRAYTLSEGFEKYAKSLQKIIDKYNGITKMNLANESAHIESLLTDLDAQKEDVTMLPGMELLIAEMRSAQEHFKADRLVYEQAVANSSLTRTASEVKKEILGIMNDKLLIYLDAMAAVAPAKYAELTALVAEIVITNNATVARRSSSKSKSADDAPTDEEEQSATTEEPVSPTENEDVV